MHTRHFWLVLVSAWAEADRRSRRVSCRVCARVRRVCGCAGGCDRFESSRERPFRPFESRDRFESSRSVVWSAHFTLSCDLTIHEGRDQPTPTRGITCLHIAIVAQEASTKAGQTRKSPPCCPRPQSWRAPLRREGYPLRRSPTPSTPLQPPPSLDPFDPPPLNALDPHRAPPTPLTPPFNPLPTPGISARAQSTSRHLPSAAVGLR